MSVLQSGVLRSGKTYELLESHRSAVEHGQHLILQITPKENDPTEEEEAELMGLSIKVAKSYASEPGRYRVAKNGSAVCTQPHIHIHIILPAGDDKLPRLVDKI